jgi:hypothetical protein
MHCNIALVLLWLGEDIWEEVVMHGTQLVLQPKNYGRFCAQASDCVSDEAQGKCLVPH